MTGTEAFSPLIDIGERRPFFQTELAFHLRGEILPASCATSLEHLSAAGGLHSLAETVDFASLSFLGLISLFHIASEGCRPILFAARPRCGHKAILSFTQDARAPFARVRAIIRCAIIIKRFTPCQLFSPLPPVFERKASLPEEGKDAVETRFSARESPLHALGSGNADEGKRRLQSVLHHEGEE